MSFHFPLQIQTVPVADPSDVSVMDLIMKSSWVINLSLLAIFGYAVYVFAERYMALRRATREEDDFLGKIKGLLHDGNIDAAKKFTSNSDGPSARMLEKGIDRLGKPLDQISLAIENTARVEAMKLSKRVGFLPVAAGASAFVGLLGTATAWVTILNPEKNADDTMRMASMVPSVEGFAIGAIALLAFYYLHNKIRKITYAMECTAVDFMDILN